MSKNWAEDKMIKALDRIAVLGQKRAISTKIRIGALPRNFTVMSNPIKRCAEIRGGF